MEIKEKFSSETESGYFRVDVIWKDGQPSTRNFPKAGFEVFETDEVGNTGKRLGFIEGKKAVEFLKKHASEYTSEEFSWKYFFEKK